MQQPAPVCYSTLTLALIFVRLIPACLVFFSVLFFQQYIKPQIVIPAVRRYLSCVVNLIGIRAALIFLGFFKFQCENYRYFDKGSRMMTFKSGWIGVVPRTNIINFLYFSYMFNPTYVRMIQYYQSGVSQDKNNSQLQPTMFYSPLSFKQAFLAALTQNGFDPIVIHGKQQMKRLKCRKMIIGTLISECFQQMNGPVLVMLPTSWAKTEANDQAQNKEEKTQQSSSSQGQPKGPQYRQQLYKMPKKLGQDIYSIQKKFLRSGLVFSTQILQAKAGSQNRQIPGYSQHPHPSQISFIFELLSEYKSNILSIVASQTIKNKYEYQASNYCEYVDQLFIKQAWPVITKPSPENQNQNQNQNQNESDNEVKGNIILKQPEQILQKQSPQVRLMEDDEMDFSHPLLRDRIQLFQQIRRQQGQLQLLRKLS